MPKLYSEAEKIDVTNRMADLMLHFHGQKGECTEDDIRSAGFTDYEIQQFGPTARGFAAMTLNNAEH